MKTSTLLRLATLAILILFWDAHGASLKVERGESGASSTRVSVLTYLTNLNSGSTNRLLIGQHDNFGNAVNQDEIVQFNTPTGRYPAFMGADYSVEGRGFNSAGEIKPTNSNTELTAYWNADGLVTISMHIQNPCDPCEEPCDPCDPGDPGDPCDPPFDENDNNVRTCCTDANLLKASTDDGNAIFTRWHGSEYLQAVRDGLQTLEDAGVIVIFRPLHEMNIGPFWWGDKDPSAARLTAFIDLWRDMHTYLVTDSGLSNLIWVYSCTGGGATHDNFTEYYPGDAYVDLVGMDVYQPETTWESNGLAPVGYTALTGLGKPFYFSEIGPDVTDKNYDFERVIDAIETYYGSAFGVMAWKNKNAFSDNLNITAVRDHAWSILRNEVDVPRPLVFRVERTTGDVYAEGAFIPSAADLAERINVSEPVEPGDLVELDPSKPGHYRKARGTSQLIAGVITSEPGFVLGNDNKPSAVRGQLSETERPMLVLVGRVPVKATTENGPIHAGDLLTASSKPGYAMRCAEAKDCEGAIIGKALEGLERGEGLILVLVM